jgi:Na+/H+ antiporter NhaD/arsenite permease-like protein
VRAKVHVLPAAEFAAALLFVLPVDWRARRFTLNWADALKIDWGTVLLMGTGLTLGRLMLDTGLAQRIGESLGSVGGGPLIGYVVTAAVAILLSEMTSNTASVSIVVPIVPGLAAAAGGDPLLAAVIATFAGTYGFMLPISTSANAIVYSSGMIPITRMIRSGFFVDFTGIVLIVGGAYVMTRADRSPADSAVISGPWTRARAMPGRIPRGHGWARGAPASAPRASVHTPTRQARPPGLSQRISPTRMAWCTAAGPFVTPSFA